MTEFSGAMRRIYNVGGAFTNARGSTAISCAADHTGYASCAITTTAGGFATSDGSTKNASGWVSSGTATAQDDVARRMNHYARRIPSSGETEYFTCNIYIGNA